MAGLQDRIDDRFTPLFDARKKCKIIYEFFIDRATILFKKIIFDIFHDTLPLKYKLWDMVLKGRVWCVIKKWRMWRVDLDK